MGRPAVFVACITALVGHNAVAQAAPNGPLPPPPPCSFVLSLDPPSDGELVATVRSTGCAALAVPYSAVVCLQPAGQVLTCSQARGDEPARVAMPYQPGASYTASGRGCAGWVGLPPAPDCQLLGPTVG